MNNKNINNRQQNSDAVKIREMLLRYLKQWHWFALSVLITLFLAVFYLKSTENKYLVKTKILLRIDNQASLVPQVKTMESFGINGFNNEVEDEMQILSSNKLMKQVVDTLNIQVKSFEKIKLRHVEKYNDMPFHLDLTPERLDTITNTYRFKIKEKNGKFHVKIKVKKHFKKKFVLNNIAETMQTPLGDFNFAQTGKIEPGSKYRVVFYPMEVLIDDYRNNIKIGTVNKQTNAIAISLVESNRDKTKDILNSLVELYNEDASLDKRALAASTAEFINERLLIITDELFDVEHDVEDYKKLNRLTNLSAETELYLKSADEYEKKRTELEIQLNMINSVEAYMKNPENDDKLIPANIVTDDQTLAFAIQEYNTALLERMKLKRTASSSNPVLLLAEEQVAALRSNVLASVNSLKSGLKIALNDLKRKDDAFMARISNVPTQEREFLEIKRQQQIKQSLYLYLLQKKEENAIRLASTAPAARIIDKAYSSLEPVEPRKSILLLVALMLGVLIPFMIIFLRDMLSNKIEDNKEFQALVKAPFLGNVAVSRERDRLVVREGKTTPIVEMFRLIRTNLQFMTGDKQSPVVLVTSSMSGEGKSFVAMNLAMSLALMQKKVMLVGLDIRNPLLAEYLHLENGKGVTIYLSDSRYSLNDIIYESKIHPHLDVIPAGPIPPNPSELLMSNRLEEMFDELKTKYDYIIVDSAPIGMVSDTYLLNRITDNTIFVARQKYTPRDATLLINEIYKEKRLNGMGVVFNGTSASAGYGYGYGYGAKPGSGRPPRVSLYDRIYELFQRG